MINPDSRGVWTDLESRLRPFVARRVSSSSDVDDVLQNVFLRMQRGLKDLRDEQRFGPWVYQVARSAIADHRRVVGRHPIPSTCAAEEPAIALDEVDERAAEEELALHVAPFIALLPSPYREALTLTELEGMTQKEAAGMLGVSLSGMKSRVQRGRLHLRELFDSCCEIALDARGRIVACEPRPERPVPCECRR
jgi:RNA polymerase sigma-70 factor (ECF subfamily)